MRALVLSDMVRTCWHGHGHEPEEFAAAVAHRLALGESRYPHNPYKTRDNYVEGFEEGYDWAAYDTLELERLKGTMTEDYWLEHRQLAIGAMASIAHTFRSHVALKRHRDEE